MTAASASGPTRVRAHAVWEFRLLIRNGEQLLLMFVIPLALLLALRIVGGGALADVVPTIITVSIIATCFTSLAIGTGFERRSGALRYAATTPLTRLDLLMGKLLATAGLSGLSLATVAIVSLLLGWRPAGGWLAVVFAALGAAAFSAWAFLLAGTMRAEAVLAVANGIFIVLMVFGGVIIPAEQMPVIGPAIALLPSSALAQGLREALDTGSIDWRAAVLLIAWAVAGAALARRSFRWD